jgi:hypothetical protein
MVDVDTDREKGVKVLDRTLTLDMGDDHGLAIGSGPAKITKVISVVVAPTGEPALVALDVAIGRKPGLGESPREGLESKPEPPFRLHRPKTSFSPKRADVVGVEFARHRGRGSRECDQSSGTPPLLMLSHTR